MGARGSCSAIPSSCSFFSTVPAMGLLLLRSTRGCAFFADRLAARKWCAGSRLRATERVAYLGRNSGQQEHQCKGDTASGGPSPKQVERDRFMVVDDALALPAALAAVGLFFLASLAPAGAQQSGPDASVVLVPHRAIYDLSLGETRGDSQITGVSGRIVYDFGGSACDGYSLDFRQVSEVDTGEGKVSISDLRSTTWEGADAKNFK